ncbi:hypothetical protein [Kitasatospora sp. NPDC090308]|uniref:hypothetical protein n=1 Tax=Kitasatospora sp. NPDC090308 TaxID=3364082 RepID=UPI003829A925
MTAQLELVLRGTDDQAARAGSGGRTDRQRAGGRAVPERGCVGAAVREPTGAADGEIGGPVFAEDADFTTLEQAQNDERTGR